MVDDSGVGSSGNVVEGETTESGNVTDENVPQEGDAGSADGAGGRAPIAVGRKRGGITEVKLGGAAQSEVRDSKIQGPWKVEVVVRGEGG